MEQPKGRFWRPRGRLTTIAILTAVYFICGKFGLMLALVHPSATAVWPCSGIALAALLILGRDVWPAILAGAFLVNLTAYGSVATSLGIAVGNTLEAVVGAVLVQRFAGGALAFSRTQDIFKFAILAAMLSTTIAATVGVTSLVLGNFASLTNYSSIWLTWWLGDAVGDVIIGSLVLLLISAPRVHWQWPRILEGIALLACLLFIGLVVFNGVLISGTEKYPLEYLCIPFLVWAAFRFGQRESAIATIALSAVAIWGTFHGFGPFVRQSPNESLLLLQTFLGVGALMTMILAAEVAHRRQAEAEAMSLALSDHLTGLGNYRRLVDTLALEIKRSIRTGKTFAFLLMDLDGLKKINDRYGHLVGSLALCRVATVLRVHCRETDTAAIYGGDEFGLILPEGDLNAARRVAARIVQRLAEDDELPTISVSIGISIWPEDGRTIEAILGEADRALYAVKKNGGGSWMHCASCDSNAARFG